jgi:predicted transcriptional regulator
MDHAAASRAQILEAISDDKSQELFKVIAKGTENEGILTSAQLSRKQYYSRISRLLHYGLVKRKKRKYVLTPFGKVIYELQLILVTAIDHNSKVEYRTPGRK